MAIVLALRETEALFLGKLANSFPTFGQYGDTHFLDSR